MRFFPCALFGEFSEVRGRRLQPKIADGHPSSRFVIIRIRAIGVRGREFPLVVFPPVYQVLPDCVDIHRVEKIEEFASKGAVKACRKHPVSGLILLIQSRRLLQIRPVPLRRPPPTRRSRPYRTFWIRWSSSTRSVSFLLRSGPTASRKTFRQRC